jgi:hypothetical protein
VFHAEQADLDKVKRLDPTNPADKRELNRIADKLKKAAGATEKADQGTHLHALSEYVDRGQPLPEAVLVEGELRKVTEHDLMDMAAYKFATANLRIRPEFIEKRVVLDEIKVTGTPDRIVEYDELDPDGEPAGSLIGDLKTGRTDIKPGTMSMQFAEYAHSKHYNPETYERTDLPEDLNRRWGLLIHLPAGTGLCELVWADLTLGWEGVELAGKVRSFRNRGKKALRPFVSSSLTTLASANSEGEEEDDGEDEDW